MGSYDVVGYFIHSRIGTAYSRGKNSDSVTQPSHNKSFIECYPEFYLSFRKTFQYKVSPNYYGKTNFCIYNV